MDGSGDFGGDVGVADAMPDMSIVEADAGPDLEVPESTDGVADASDFAEVAAERDAAMADASADGDMADNVADAGDFAAQTEEQQLAAVEFLQEIEGISPEAWDQLDTDGRVEVMQDIENRMAEIQGRPSVPIVVDPSLSDTEFGGWNRETGEISVNASHLAGNEYDVDEFVDTAIHEGRHVYQDYAVDNPGVMDPEAAANFEVNRDQYFSPRDDPEAYQSQPIEADAWAYASEIRQALYGAK